MYESDKILFERLVCALSANPNVFRVSSSMSEAERQQQRRELMREACALLRTCRDFPKDERVQDYLYPSRVRQREMWSRVMADAHAKPGQQ